MPMPMHTCRLWKDSKRQTSLIGNSKCSRPSRSTSFTPLPYPLISNPTPRIRTAARRLRRATRRNRRACTIPVRRRRHRRTSSQRPRTTSTHPTLFRPCLPRGLLRDIRTPLPSRATMCTDNLRISSNGGSPRTDSEGSSITSHSHSTTLIRCTCMPPLRPRRRRRRPTRHRHPRRTTRLWIRRHRRSGTAPVGRIRIPLACPIPSHSTTMRSMVVTAMPERRRARVRKSSISRRHGSRLGCTSARLDPRLEVFPHGLVCYIHTLAFAFHHHFAVRSRT